MYEIAQSVFCQYLLISNAYDLKKIFTQLNYHIKHYKSIIQVVHVTTLLFKNIK